MPVIIRKIELPEGPYSGWWAMVQTNPPMRVVQQLSDAVTTAGEILDKLIQDWNFVDAAGQPLPITAQAIDGELPVDLFRAFYKAYMSEVWHPFWLETAPAS